MPIYWIRVLYCCNFMIIISFCNGYEGSRLYRYLYFTIFLSVMILSVVLLFYARSHQYQTWFEPGSPYLLEAVYESIGSC